MSMCKVFVSCGVGKGCLLWASCSLNKTLLAVALLHFVLQGQICLLLPPGISWLPTFAFESHLMNRTSFFVIISRKCYRSHKTNNFSFFSISDWSTNLDYCDIESFTLEINWDHSVIFEVAPKYCISDCFVDSEGCSISSKAFLHTVIRITFIWILWFSYILVHWFLRCQCSILPSPAWPYPVDLDSWP